MPRWKKPTKEEVLENRRDLANRARSGELRLPHAVAEIRKGFGMTQEEVCEDAGAHQEAGCRNRSRHSEPDIGDIGKNGRLFGFGVGFVPGTIKKTESERDPAPKGSHERT
ncbi:putative transcriptional regulator [Sinorhizobium medicae]